MSVTSRENDKSNLGGEKQETAGTGLSDEKKMFFQNLRNLDPGAIRHLAQRIGTFLSSLSASGILTTEDKEELINDATFITLQKIGNGQFELRDADPATYAIAVAKNLVGNFIQKKRIETAPIETLSNISSDELDPEKYFQAKEREIMVGALLDKLDAPCKQLILLRYYEEISDEEAIAQKRTLYSNTDSLKAQRSKCLKKLGQIARKHKELFR